MLNLRGVATLLALAEYLRGTSFPSRLRVLEALEEEADADSLSIDLCSNRDEPLRKDSRLRYLRPTP
jgi:Zn-dependent M28 family amino/carboxypeptidase